MARSEEADTDVEEPQGLDSTQLAEPSDSGELPLLGETVAPDSVDPAGFAELHRLEELPRVGRERYALEASFARGGIGTICRARDMRLDRIVAIKELRRRHSSYARLRFAREIRLTARLSHPSIVPLYEAGRWPSGEPFFAMKLVEGSSLDEAIDRCSERRERMELLGHVADVADAIAYAHSQGVVHRDLKPANILVGPFGETVVIDWGLAKDMRHPDDDDLPAPDVDSLRERYQTTDGAVMGTPPYMPPEQAEGRWIDERADVYALGAILYHLLGGRIPYFEVPPREILERVVAGPPAPLVVLEPDLPPDLLAIVSKAMARDPADRYRSAQEMAKELRLFRSGQLVGAYTYSPLELAQRFVARHRAAVLVSLLALLVLVVFGAWSFRKVASARDRAEEARQAAEVSAAAEASARAQAEERLEQAILAGARTALMQDPTLALAMLAQLEAPRAGAPSVAADAVERGVARAVLAGHVDRIETVALSPAGEVVAAGGIDGTILLFEGGEVRPLEGHADRVSGLAFSEQGLVSVGYDGRLSLWRDGRLVSRKERASAIRGLAVSAERAATVGDDGVRLFKLGEPIEELWMRPAPADRPLFARFSPDGRTIATGSHRGAVWLHDLDGGAPTLLSHPAEVKGVAFSPDGKQLASACVDGRVRIFALGAAEPLRLREAHLGAVEAVAFVDERRVVSGGFDGEVVLWDLEHDTLQPIATHGERVVTLLVDPGGTQVASASWDKTVAVTDLRGGAIRRFHGHRDVVSALAFTRDGRTLASASWDREVRLWALADDERKRIVAHRVGVKAIAFSPDGMHLASGGHDNTVRLWRVSDGREAATFSGHSDHVYRVVFSPDGRSIASSSDDRTVRLWPVDGSPPVTLSGHTADVEELAFSQDGKLLASAGEDHAVGLWEVESGSGKLLRGHRAAVSDVAFSPRHLASASRDGTVRFWTLAGEHEETWELGAEVTDLAFSADHVLLAASAGDAVWLREERNGSRIEIDGLRAPQSLAFSPDGGRLAVGSARGALWLCTVASRHCVELQGHDARIHALVFTPDGAGLLSASADGTVRAWDLESGESAPMRAHSTSVFDVAIAPDGSLAASASGDMTIALFRPRRPPTASGLTDFIAAATQLRVPR